MSAALRYLPMDNAWATIGVEHDRGVTAEGIVASANAWGPDQLTFTLKAEHGSSLPHLHPYSPVELEVDGMLVWSGRVKGHPAVGREHSVQCEGWQYHLDDDLLSRSFVRAGLLEYVDGRDLDIALSPQFVINAGRGRIQIALPDNVTAGSGGQGAVIVDTGDDVGVKRIVVTYEGGGSSGLGLFASNGATSPFNTEETTLDAAPVATGNNTVAHTFGTARRWFRLSFRNTSGAGKLGDNNSWVRIKAVLIFRDTAYESGNASILKADQVVKAARDGGAPLLNTSNALISAGTFSIPDFASAGAQSPRELMEAVNVLERFRLKLAGADLKTLLYGAFPTAPLFELGEWSGMDPFSDDSMTGEEIYDQVIVEGREASGEDLSVTRTQTGTLVDRRGFHRTRTITVNRPGTTAAFNQLGDLWLTEHARAPFAGKLTIRGDSIRTVLAGTSIPAHSMLLHAGEVIRLGHRVDPDTGDLGRAGRIAGVTYTHEDRSAAIDIDDRRSQFDRVLSLYDIVGKRALRGALR